jgi:Sulfotransferase family
LTLGLWLVYILRGIKERFLLRLKSRLPSFLKQSISHFLHSVTVLDIFEKNFNSKWPLAQIMVDQVYRILYCPIAKNACSSLKRSFVDFGSLPIDSELLNTEDIHKLLDSRNTGYLLKDLPAEVVRDILLDESYFRFAVLRDPLERLLSVYREKFVKHRLDPDQWFHTGPVMAEIQKCTPQDVNFETGITFEKMMQYILKSRQTDLDEHWRPQYLYLSVLNCKNLYLNDDLLILAENIQLFSGKKFQLRRDNVSRNDSHKRFVKNAFRLSASELYPIIGGISTDSFYNEYYRSNLNNYYSIDNMITSGLRHQSQGLLSQ